MSKYLTNTFISPVGLLVLWTLSIFPCVSSGQEGDKALDSLIALASELGAGKQKVNLYSEVSNRYYEKSDYDNAYKYGELGLELAKRIGYDKGTGRNYHLLGMVHTARGSLAQAMEFHTRAIEILSTTDYRSGLANAYNSLGVVYGNRSDYGDALKNYFRALDIHKELADTNGIVFAYNNIATIYTKMGESDRALSYLKKAFDECEKNIKPHTRAVIYSNMANISAEKRDFDRARQFASEALRCMRGSGDRRNSATILRNLGTYCQESERYEEALNYLTEALNLHKEIGDRSGEAWALSSLGLIYMMKNDLDKSAAHLNEALALVKKEGHRTVLGDIYFNMSLLDSVRGDHASSFRNFKSFYAFLDSMRQQESSEKLTRLAMGYEFEEKSRANELKREKEEELRKEKASRRKMIINCLLIALAAMLAFAYVIYRNLKLRSVFNARIREQKSIIERKQSELLDSINYARRIQQASMKPVSYFEKNLGRLRTMRRNG